ncbi:MAG TPA: class I SAM-dependent methyltransferase [Thermoleophilaceae bacterium]
MDTTFYSEYYEIEDRHWWFVGRREVLMRVLADHLEPGRDRRILDVGCGTGTMLAHLGRFGTAQGVDASEEAVAFCHQRGLDDVGLLDDGPLPFGDDTFDLVTAFDVIEHVDDDLGLLRDFRRVVAPGGHVMVSVPAYRFLWGPQDEISHHKRRYVRRELTARFEEAGLTVLRSTYFNTLLFPPIAAIRVLRPAKPAEELESDFTLTKPGRVNSLLGRVFASEARLVGRTDLPFGVSILALARNDG